jgi:hypothetical protein
VSRCGGERYSDGKGANRDVWDFGWAIAHAVVTRRPPISLYMMVPRTGGYTYDVGVWDLSIVQGPFSVAPCQTYGHDSFFFQLYCTTKQNKRKQTWSLGRASRSSRLQREIRSK